MEAKCWSPPWGSATTAPHPGREWWRYKYRCDLCLYLHAQTCASWRLMCCWPVWCFKIVINVEKLRDGIKCQYFPDFMEKKGGGRYGNSIPWLSHLDHEPHTGEWRLPPLETHGFSNLPQSPPLPINHPTRVFCRFITATAFCVDWWGQGKQEVFLVPMMLKSRKTKYRLRRPGILRKTGECAFYGGT